MIKQFKQHVLAVTMGLVGVFGNAQAAPYSGVVFFGDSLSDTGNVLSLTSAFAPPPFPSYPLAPGRFSNGPVWTEYLAAGLGFAASARPSNLILAGPPIVNPPAVIAIGPQGGQNFSFGGARTGLGGSAGATTGLLGQLTAWNGSVFDGALTRAADSNALYVVVAGANDLRDARSLNPGGALADAAARLAAANTAAANLTQSIAALAQAGARHFLISNLPDLGRTPEAVGLGVVAASTDVTLRFNSALAADAAALDAQFVGLFGVDLDIKSFDFYGLSAAVYDDAVNHGGAGYGVTNATAPCLAAGPLSHQYFFADATDINCGVSLFSDPLHPSGAAHRLIGNAALAVAVPEPASLLLLLLGLAFAGVAVPRPPGPAPACRAA